MAGAVRRGMERGIGAIAGGEDSRRGAWGQLAGGMIEVQVAKNSVRVASGRERQRPCP